MIELTEQQEQAIAVSETPVRMLDRRTNREYVLLRAEQFERMRRALEAEAVDPSFFEFEEIEHPSA